MQFWMSVLFFGIPAAIGVLSVYVALPALDRADHTIIWTYNLTLYGVLALLPFVALIAYRFEGRSLSVIVHFALNGLGFVMILLGVLGVGSQ